MEENSGIAKENQHQMDLPPGFRFHPTDEELITHYLMKKVLDCSFSSKAIAEVDMNKVEPWDLPWLAKMGEKEWYFFCLRDKKYPAGQRTNRATPSGYWKATGKDKEIFRGNELVGMKKTLVFYLGRAPKGEKSNWVSHEYRLEGNFSADIHVKSVKSDWVISRVFQKTSGVERVEKSGLMEMSSEGNEVSALAMAAMVDSSVGGGIKLGEMAGGYMPFANSSSDIPQHVLENSLGILGSPILPSCLDSFTAEGFPLGYGMIQGDPAWAQSMDPFILRTLTENYEQNLNQGLGDANGLEMLSVSQGAENPSVAWNHDMGKQVSSEEQEAGPSSSNQVVGARLGELIHTFYSRN